MADLPDYSEWLSVGDRLEREEAAWEQLGAWRENAAAVVALGEAIGCKRVIELGCGTGWVAAALPDDWHYLGIDANPGCIELALKRCAQRFVDPCRRSFTQANIRDVLLTPLTTHTGVAPIFCAFAVLKHFAPPEAELLLQNMLHLSAASVFTLTIADHVHDDGVEFHHSWLTRGMLNITLAATGHETFAERCQWQNEDGTRSEWLISTRRKP